MSSVILKLVRSGDKVHQWYAIPEEKGSLSVGPLRVILGLYVGFPRHDAGREDGHLQSLLYKYSWRNVLPQRANFRSCLLIASPYFAIASRRLTYLSRPNGSWESMTVSVVLKFQGDQRGRVGRLMIGYLLEKTLQDASHLPKVVQDD
jgi:hypothetical protein